MNSLKFSQFSVNCSGLNTALGFGVTSLSNRASIASGMNGVGVTVGVSVVEGVLVMVGESVIVGESVMVGESVIVGVSDDVGDGGKYRYATGSPYFASPMPAASNNNPKPSVYHPPFSRWRLIR